MNEHQKNLSATEQVAPKLVAERQGALFRFILNRPQSLNAFDDEMCAVLAREIPLIARNPDLYICAILSSSPKAFCAGGDVLSLTALAKSDPAAARQAFKNEYTLNWLLECFSKPTVSFIDGLCMGSGCGLSSFNTHRIAGENYKWAMPETRIGLFPDVGIAKVLSRLPWPLGLYLGLTGRIVTRGDAQWLGLVTHCIPSSRFPDILAKLADAQPVDPILDAENVIQKPGPLQGERSIIEDYFSAADIGGIVRNLEKATGSSKEWAEKTLADLRSMSPLSLAITDRHIRSALQLEIRETLIQDYRVADRCLSAHDFFEGVRAFLRDKDKKPVWQYPSIEAVPPDVVNSYFEPLNSGDLSLPSREDMQAARV